MNDHDQAPHARKAVDPKIIGLFQGGTNNPENLVLTRDQPEHRKITGQQNSAMAGMNYGHTRTVDVLYPPKGTVIYKGTP